MSQIFNKYQELKKNDPNTMYLFRSGNFYIFIGEDADTINEYVVLKKTNFCKEAMKCGFPMGSLEEYLKVFQNHGLKIQVIESLEEKDFNQAMTALKKIDLDRVTPIRALNILKELKELM